MARTLINVTFGVWEAVVYIVGIIISAVSVCVVFTYMWPQNGVFFAVLYMLLFIAVVVPYYIYILIIELRIKNVKHLSEVLFKKISIKNDKILLPRPLLVTRGYLSVRYRDIFITGSHVAFIATNTPALTQEVYFPDWSGFRVVIKGSYVDLAIPAWRVDDPDSRVDDCYIAIIPMKRIEFEEVSDVVVIEWGDSRGIFEYSLRGTIFACSVRLESKKRDVDVIGAVVEIHLLGVSKTGRIVISVDAPEGGGVFQYSLLPNFERGILIVLSESIKRWTSYGSISQLLRALSIKRENHIYGFVTIRLRFMLKRKCAKSIVQERILIAKPKSEPKHI